MAKNMFTGSLYKKHNYEKFAKLIHEEDLRAQNIVALIFQIKFNVRGRRIKIVKH